jgi:hypothetical protein
MHTLIMTFNAIISGTIAADAAQVAPARQRKCEASHHAPRAAWIATCIKTYNAWLLGKKCHQPLHRHRRQQTMQ